MRAHCSGVHMPLVSSDSTKADWAPCDLPRLTVRRWRLNAELAPHFTNDMHIITSVPLAEVETVL